jgi:hypothetical protein
METWHRTGIALPISNFDSSWEVIADLHAPDALPIGKDALVSMQETEKRKISASSKNRTPNHQSSGLVRILTELFSII